MKSWENVFVSGVRTQVTSHHLKTWKREHCAQFYCRNVETEITQNPHGVKLSFFPDFSLLIPLVYDLIMAGCRVTILRRRMMKQSRRGGGILCKNWSNQLPLDATFPTVIKKSAKSLLLYPVNLMNIFALNILSKRFMIFDTLFVGIVSTLTTMLQQETNITVALSVAWLETRVRDLK